MVELYFLFILTGEFLKIYLKLMLNDQKYWKRESKIPRKFSHGKLFQKCSYNLQIIIKLIKFLTVISRKLIHTLSQKNKYQKSHFSIKKAEAIYLYVSNLSIKHQSSSSNSRVVQSNNKYLHIICIYNCFVQLQKSPLTMFSFISVLIVLRSN